MWHRSLLIFLLLLICSGSAGKYFESGVWTYEAPTLDDSFFKTARARKVGDILLEYQGYKGGFPKNLYFPDPPKMSEKDFFHMKNNYSYMTIDNNATTTEIIYLARLYNATKAKKYKEAAINGINFLTDLQYENGGYSQKGCNYKKHYHENITFNDNAIVNVLTLLQTVAKKEAPFTFADEITVQKAQKAFNKGIECILNCQIKRNGILTGWCAQHDKITLKPCDGRTYEKASISGKESDEIVLLLMSIENPSKEIVNSIEAAVKWFKDSQINGIKPEWTINANKLIDYKMVECKNCPPIWGRFYEIETNNVFFCDRDGIKKANINEISQERRIGYDWYSIDGLKLFKEYEKWKQKNTGN